MDVIGEKEHTCNILTDYRGLLLHVHVRMYIVKCVVMMMTTELSSFYNTKTTARNYYRLLEITRDY